MERVKCTPVGSESGLPGTGVRLGCRPEGMTLQQPHRIVQRADGRQRFRASQQGGALRGQATWKDAFLTCWQRLSALPAPA